MSFTDWGNVIRLGKLNGVDRIQFIGGEPTIHPDFDRLIRLAAKGNSTNIELFTNANAITEARAKLLAESSVKVSVSLYSAQPNSHNTVTGDERSFHKTLLGVSRMHREGVQIYGSFIETEANAGEYESAREFWRNQGVCTMRFDRERKIGRSATNSGSIDQISELCGKCGDRRLCVTGSGELYPCVMARQSSLGNYFDGDLDASVLSNRLSKFRQNMIDAGHDTAVETSESCRPDFDGCPPTGPCPPDHPCTPMDPPDCNPDAFGD